MKMFRDLTIDCGGRAPDEVVDAIGQSLSPRWNRRLGMEQRSLNWGEVRGYCFARKSDSLAPAVDLWLGETDDRNLVVRNIVPAEAGQLSIDQYNKILEDFYKESRIPLVQELFLPEPQMTSSEWHLEEQLVEETRSKLTKFSKSANRSTGTAHPCDEERWFDFIISVHQNGPSLSEVPPSLLRRWLVEDEGWPEASGWTLASEYEKLRHFLKYYDKHG